MQIETGLYQGGIKIPPKPLTFAPACNFNHHSVVHRKRVSACRSNGGPCTDQQGRAATLWLPRLHFPLAAD